MPRAPGFCDNKIIASHESKNCTNNLCPSSTFPLVCLYLLIVPNHSDCIYTDLDTTESTTEEATASIEGGELTMVSALKYRKPPKDSTMRYSQKE